jgi:hypothetical protein
LSAGFADSGAKVIGVVGPVGENIFGGQVGDQRLGLRGVVVLTGGEDEAHRVAKRIDAAWSLVVRPPRLRPMERSSAPLFTRGVLMRPDDGRVDDDVFEVGIVRLGVEKIPPHPILRPPREASEHTVPFAEYRRQVTPWRHGIQGIGGDIPQFPKGYPA